MEYVLILTYRWHDRPENYDSCVAIHSIDMDNYDAACEAGRAWVKSIGNTGATFVVAPKGRKDRIYIHAPYQTRTKNVDSEPKTEPEEPEDDDLPF